MKNVLYVSAYQIFPAQTGGHIRAANVVQGLAAAGCNVRIFSFSSRAAEYGARIGSMDHDIQAGVSEFVDRRLSFRAYQGVNHRLKIPPFWESVLSRIMPLPKPLQERLDWCDTIMINHFYLYPLLARAVGKRRIINSHNLEHKMWQEYWWQRRLLTPLVKILEKRAGKVADAILCCAPDEARFFQHHALPETRLYDVPNAVFPKLYRRNDLVREKIRRDLGLGAEERCILFVGSRYAPNLDALNFLKHFSETHAELLAAHKLKFLIVGSVAAKAFQSQTMSCTGFVEDVLPYFQAADFAINPVMQGSGTNVKVFEYLASALPIFSTQFGKRGFDLSPSTDFFEFTRENLADVIRTDVVGQDSESLASMAARAFTKNRLTVDMEAIMGKVVRDEASRP